MHNYARCLFWLNLCILRVTKECTIKNSIVCIFLCVLYSIDHLSLLRFSFPSCFWNIYSILRMNTKWIKKWILFLFSSFNFEFDTQSVWLLKSLPARRILKVTILRKLLWSVEYTMRQVLRRMFIIASKNVQLI